MPQKIWSQYYLWLQPLLNFQTFNPISKLSKETVLKLEKMSSGIPPYETLCAIKVFEKV